MRDAAVLFKALGRGGGENPREMDATGAELVGLLSTLKGMGDFMLLDIDAVDYPECFRLSYRLLDKGGEGAVGLFTVKVRAEKSDPHVPSIIDVWKAADVLEREVWDLMGVRFDGRESMKRILCRDDFQGHPLRKDYVVEQPPRFPGAGAGQ